MHNLDRRITITRYANGQPNEIGEIVDGEWQDRFTVWAKREDVSDGEKFAAGGIGSFLSARFIVRSSPDTRSILPSDMIRHEGRDWNIVGMKEAAYVGRTQQKLGRRRFLEITARVDADG